MTTESAARTLRARKHFARPLPAVLRVALSGLPLAAQGPPADQAEARRALNKVLAFYCGEVGCNGAYLWRYAADLSR